MKIETPRTYIREFTLEDAEAVLAFNGNAQVTKYTGDADMVSNLADAKSVIQDVWLQEYNKYGYGRWAVVDKGSGRVIGFCGLKYIPEVGLPDVGYRFLPEYWGKGYASETAVACIQYCKEELGITRFFGDVMEQNVASVKVLKKLGLRFSGFIDYCGETYQRYLMTTPTMINTNQFYK